MKRKGFIIAFSVLVAIMIVAACVAKFYVFATWSGDDVRVNIPAGADVRSVLTSQLGPSFGGKVYNMWKWQDGTTEGSRGSYVIHDGDEAVRVARRIAQGRQTPVQLTYNNIRTIGDMAVRVASQLELDSAAFMAACDSILSIKGFAKEQYVSAFVPDTYEFYWTATPVTVVNRLLDERDKYWDDSRRAKATALGLTPAEVHTLASIVASESNKTDEWGKIARLYLNRISKNMPLQADPTVVFALGDFSIRRVTGVHLKVDSPYNTYTHRGLPPGPIRMVERAQLDAVLDSPAHDYLYMCAKPDFSGYHNFAKDYQRHRLNAALYYRALEARGL